MDLHTVASYRFARHRADLALAPGERLIAGGTWLFSDDDPTVTGLVDLTTMPWQPWEATPTGLSVAATCTIATLAELKAEAVGEAVGEAVAEVVGEVDWRALPLFGQCAEALLASWKVQQVATVGGNVARAFSAAAMVSLLVTLDADAVIWTPEGGERVADVADLVAGNGISTLAEGEVLRSFEIPARALRARTGYAKLALVSLGRSGTLVTGRRDEDDTTTLVVTAATARARRLRYPAPPTPERLSADVAALPDYYTDPLGTADWRRGTASELAGRVLAQLVGP